MAQADSGSSTKLYTPRLLSLAAELANYPLTDDLPHRAEARSRTCGSTITAGLALDDQGRIERIGMQVSACAVGQSSAAIMASGAQGCSLAEFQTALAEIEAWLGGEGSLPSWHGFDALEPALPHAGRHGALSMPWRAITDALSSASSSR